MNRHALIATRHAKEVQKDASTTIGNLSCFLTRAGWEVHFLENEESMYKAYSTKINALSLHAQDQVILCHDDIEILLSEEIFNRILSKWLEDPKTGFVGVAGSQIITEEANWFKCAQKYKAGGGIVFHGTDTYTMIPSYYGGSRKAVIMDGVFLASTGRVLNTINLNMPKDFVGKWDWYDAMYTFQAYKKNLTNIIAPILLRHESGGRYPKEWHDDKPKFISLFEDHIPAIAK